MSPTTSVTSKKAGEFPERAPPNAISDIQLTLRASELRAHFGRCGETANWLSSYLSHELAPAGRKTAENVLSTVLNEVVENGVKFCSDTAGRVKIRARHLGEVVRIELWNTASRARAELLHSTVRDVTSGHASELFTERVARGGGPDAPGIGLLIIKRDYGGRLGSALTPRPDGDMDVYVVIELDLAELHRT